MKFFKTFESFDANLDPRIELLNRYLKKPIAPTAYRTDATGKLLIETGLYFNTDKVDFDSLSELNLGDYEAKTDLALVRLKQNGRQLHDLQGLPKKVQSLDVASNNLLSTEGGTDTIVSYKFNMSFNKNVKNLMGMPQCQGATVLINMCPDLESLEGFTGCEKLYLLGNDKLKDVSALEDKGPITVVVYDLTQNPKFPNNVTLIDHEADAADTTTQLYKNFRDK